MPPSLPLTRRGSRQRTGGGCAKRTRGAGRCPGRARPLAREGPSRRAPASETVLAPARTLPEGLTEASAEQGSCT
eukprot:6568610-Pyramimonas_sp.AAC.1